jgi:hypothetical protein
MSLLPHHLKSEVAMWLGFRASHPDSADTPYWAARFVFEVLTTKTLTVRLSCVSALNQYFRDYRAETSPFAAQPLPYSLLAKFVPFDYQDAVGWLRGLKGTERAYAALVLIGRASVAEVMDGFEVKSGVLFVGETRVPVTDEVVGWLAAYVKPRRKADVTAALGGRTVSDLHGCLFAELIRRGVPELTRAGLYGRWSAMELHFATHPVTYFRVRV